MKSICENTQKQDNHLVWDMLENRYSVIVLPQIKEFMALNGGRRPKQRVISIDGQDYRIRVFLSLDPSNPYYYIEKPLESFLSQTSHKIIPIGIDSGDNYYCVNNETGKVYYWSANLDEYFCISDSLDSFSETF